MKNFYIIGCGGVCSYFLGGLLKTVNHDKRLKNSTVTLVDGDMLEDKNYMRQMFNEGMSGINKAEALATMFGAGNPNVKLEVYSQYITDLYPVEPKSTIFCFTDNHPARKDILSIADREKCDVIVAANGELAAHAYYYKYDMKDTALDPRVRYPEILSIDRGSPVRAAGCQTEEHLDNSPQTPIANLMAASHAALLWAFWQFESKTLDPELSLNSWPIEFSNTEGKTRTTTIGDLSK